MKKTFGTKVFAVLAALAVLLTFALPKAACAQSVYPDTGDFELRCVYGNMPLENMRFSVYRVADMPSLGKFSLLPAFEESGADIVVTDCETCKWQIEMSTSLRCEHPITLLAKALG